MDIIGWIFIGGLAIGFIVGIFRGFFDQLLGFIGTIAALVLAAVFCKYPEAWLVGLIEADWLRPIVAYIITAFVMIAVVTIVKWAIKKLLSKIKILKITDKLLGAVLGAGITYVVFAALYAIANTTLNLPVFQDVVDNLMTAISDSPILKAVYESFNPIGSWIVGLIGLAA